MADARRSTADRLGGHTGRSRGHAMGFDRIRANVEGDLDGAAPVTAAERRHPPATVGQGILALQGTAGNRAVAQLLGAASRRRAGDKAERYTTTDSVIANAASL